MSNSKWERLTNEDAIHGARGSGWDTTYIAGVPAPPQVGRLFPSSAWLSKHRRGIWAGENKGALNRAR